MIKIISLFILLTNCTKESNIEELYKIRKQLDVTYNENKESLE